MKAVLRWCVIPLFAAALVAQTTPKPKRMHHKPAQPVVTMQDVQELKDALAAQQQQINELKQELQQKDQAWQQSQQQLQQAQTTASEAQQKAASVEATATQEQDHVAKLSTDVKDLKTTMTNTAVSTQEDQKRVSALESALGRFRFTGDIRVRGESFFQDGAADRNRARIRVRFGIDGKLNEDFVGGLALATGTLGDPTSTNSTLTNFFDKHTIGLDRGYITYNPSYADWVSITGGKFAYTWQRTSVTFDPDLNPEGFSEKFSWNVPGSFLKNVNVMGMQLLYNESSSGTDSYALGGQFGAKLQAGPWTATPSYTLLKWNNPDSILAASTFSVQASPGEGPGCSNPSGFTSANCAFAPNKMTNATYLDPSGKAHFYSQFLYSDFILNNQIKTGSARLPLNLLLEYEQNLDAKAHPLAQDGSVLTGLGSQDKTYLADLSFGQTKNKNDIQFGYAWLRQEQDSVISSFDESDQRAPTNVLQNRFYLLWKLQRNTVASYTFWYGHTLNTALQNALRSPNVAAGESDAYLKRMQFDLIYSF